MSKRPYRVFKQYDHWWMYCEENDRLVTVAFTIEQLWKEAATYLKPVRVDPGAFRAI